MARARQQQESLGKEFECREVPEVEEAAENYRALRDERMDLAEREAAAKKTLIGAMETHMVNVYRYVDSDGVDRRVTLEVKKNAKVGKIKSSDDGGGSAGGDDATDVSVQ